MAKMSEEMVRESFVPHLLEGEALSHVAVGVRQPPILLIIVLIALGILPGIIATVLLTRSFCVGLTDRRLIVLRTASVTNLVVKSVLPYDLEELKSPPVRTWSGGIYTFIVIENEEKPFRVKFHRALTPFNRPNAEAIGRALTRAGA